MQPTMELPPDHHEQGVNQELRHATDTATWMAELLYGSMRTSFDFTYNGYEIRAEDNGSMDEVFDDAITEARLMTEENPSMAFELRRRLYERGELEDMKEMVSGTLFTDSGEEANTMVVVSDYPPELMNSSDDLGGYNGSRKQTMLRIITKGENGVLTVVSRSLDLSNRTALEKLGLAIGRTYDEGELLDQRTYLNIPEEWQPKLENILVDTYDESLAEQFGGSWHAGIKQPDNRALVNTYEFANAQQDLIQLFSKTKISDPKKAESMRFQIAATVNERFEKFILNTSETDLKNGIIRPDSEIVIRAVANMHPNLDHEMVVAAQRAALKGMVFSGCGISVSAEGDSEDSLSSSAATRLGFGNKASGKKNLCKFPSKKCPECKKTNIATESWEENNEIHIKGSCGCHKVSPKPKAVAVYN